MTEDIQTGEIIMSTSIPVQALPALSQTQRRAISQHDLERNKNGNQGGTVSRKSVSKHKNSSNGKREVTYNRSLKKTEPKYAKKFEDFGTRSSRNTENLLNFQYMSSRSIHGGSSSTFRKRRTTFNKEAFVQANCHFVVDFDEEKYLVHSVDPDVLVEWDAIRLIYLPTHESPKCPICLYPPTAAKITKCGHVYCWTCVIHYLSLNEKSWSKCPICYESIHEKDLKSVISIVKDKFSRSGTITMKLMKRPKDSLIACLGDDCDLNKKLFSIWEGQDYHPLSKITMATKKLVLDNILVREKAELVDQLNKSIQEQDGEEKFINMALEKLGEYIVRYETCVSDNENKLEINQFNVTVEAPNMLFEAVQMSNTTKEDTTSKFQQLNIIDDKNSEDVIPSKNEFYYFYQAEDGQNIFINSLNARCLIEEYGCLENAPKKIVGQILDFDSFSMTKDLRKRYRYLGHLPIYCEFVICELMLRPPVLSKQTIHNFMSDFKKRKALRLKKIEEQRKHDIQADLKLNRSAGFHVRAFDENEIHLDLDDQTDFPSYLSPDETAKNSDIVVANDDNEGKNSGPSFAQMLKSSSCNSSKNFAWQQHDQDNGNYTKRLIERNEGNEFNGVDDDNDVPAPPTLKQMFSAATQSIVKKNTSFDSSVKTKSITKGKKGKAKGTLLFSTGAQRKY